MSVITKGFPPYLNMVKHGEFSQQGESGQEKSQRFPKIYLVKVHNWGGGKIFHKGPILIQVSKRYSKYLFFPFKSKFPCIIWTSSQVLLRGVKVNMLLSAIGGGSQRRLGNFPSFTMLN